MGSKYTTNAASGYNSSPPPDDGTQVASNLIAWSGIKTKLADPVKTLADAIDTDLVSAFNYTPRRISSSDNVVADDHMRVVEIAPTATSGLSVTLPDASTIGTLFRTYIKNSSAYSQTIARTTGGDTIDGTASDVTLLPKSSVCISTNNNASSVADGYIIAGSAEGRFGLGAYKLGSIQNFTSIGSDTWTKPAGCLAVLIKCLAPGGGGGGADSDGTGTGGAGGGGGGGYAEKFITSGLGSTETVTVGIVGTAGSATNGTAGGNGGATSFGAHVSCTGGSGGTGTGVTTSATGQAFTGGAGGAGSSGTINTEGGDGGPGMGTAATSIGGTGGSSIFGSGGSGGVTAGAGTAVAGSAGNNYGGGGGGAADVGAGSGAAGGAGGPGIVIVYEYY